jgi:hypothetical protein
MNFLGSKIEMLEEGTDKKEFATSNLSRTFERSLGLKNLVKFVSGMILQHSKSITTRVTLSLKHTLLMQRVILVLEQNSQQNASGDSEKTLKKK